MNDKLYMYIIYFCRAVDDICFLKLIFLKKLFISMIKNLTLAIAAEHFPKIQYPKKLLEISEILRLSIAVEYFLEAFSPK